MGTRCRPCLALVFGAMLASPMMPEAYTGGVAGRSTGLGFPGFTLDWRSWPAS